MRQVERIMSAAQQLSVISGRPSARCCGSMSAARAACTGCWTGGLGRRESTESSQAGLSVGFDGSWAQAFASIGGCATARWDVPRPACCASESYCALTCACTVPRAQRCGSLGACLTPARPRASSQACNDAAFASMISSKTAELLQLLSLDCSKY